MAEADAFQPQDPGYEARVRASYAEQRVMGLLGARLGRVAPGLVEIALPYREDLTQQDRFLHAGALATVMDSAGGYAAMSLTPAGATVLSAEFRVHLLRPATGGVLARGRVVRPGRTLTVCEMEAVPLEEAGGGRVAWGSQTIAVRRASPPR